MKDTAPIPRTLKCGRCHKRKKTDKFSPSPRHRNGLFPWCRPCKATYQANYIDTVPKDMRVEKQRVWRAQRDADSEARAHFLRKTSAYSLKRRYGITSHEIVELAAFQEKVCAICKAAPDVTKKRGGLHIDHDHATKKVRGLLCESCNQGLGFFKDSVFALRAAIAYLQSPPASLVTFTVLGSSPVFPTARRNPEKQVFLNLVCKQCRKKFKRKAQAEFSSRAKGKEGPFCGSKCAGTWSQKQQKVRGLIHGATNGYTYHRCRCVQCRKAHASAERRRKTRTPHNSTTIPS